MSRPPPNDGRAGYCAVAVMAKAPRRGEVKTRLAPPLSPAQAAELSECFIRDIADNILAAGRAAPIHGYVAYSPPDAAALIRAMVPEAIALLPPRETGLGPSLAAAAQDLLAAGYGSVCLVNADSPTLPTAFLVDAVLALSAPGDRVVLGPADDGGYYCIGLKRAHLRLFEDIAWSTAAVFGQTLDRAGQIGLDTIVLPRWYDVDDVASLRRVAGELLPSEGGDAEAGHYPARWTAALLRRLIREATAARRAIDWPGFDASDARQ